MNKKIIIPESLFYEGIKAMDAPQLGVFKNNVDPWTRETTESFVELFYKTYCCEQWKKRLEEEFPFLKKPVSYKYEDLLPKLQEFDTFYISGRGEIIKDTHRTPVNSRHDSVLSEKRAKSVLAYIKLSVIADLLNDTIPLSMSKENNCLYSIYYIVKSDKIKICISSHRSILILHTNTLYFKTKEVVEKIVKENLELVKDYFMIDEREKVEITF